MESDKKRKNVTKYSKMNQNIVEITRTNNEIKQILIKAKEKLTLEGRKAVFEDGDELKTEHMYKSIKPETFTLRNIVEPTFKTFGITLNAEVTYRTENDVPNWIDRESVCGKLIMPIQAKPLNAELEGKSKNSAVNQIKKGYKLAKFRDDYENGGIATDGYKYIFINSEGEIIDRLNIANDYEKIRKLVTGKTTISLQKRDEISREFYKKYNEILHGGKHISEEDCFIESIKNVDKIEEREEIAQLIINRLLFIKFLYEREFIKIFPSDSDFFDYLKKLETTEVNRELKVLFFNIMNTPKELRTNVDIRFSMIPYLNGSLFEKAEVEKNNSDYLIDSRIIQETIKLLDSYTFADKEIGEEQIRIDPEILGYIFESAMTAQDRKGTGAFYTKKSITKYMAQKTIYQTIINKVNKYLLEKKEYKNTELIKNIDQIYTLNETTLVEVWRDIIREIKICDIACGSGAFIIAMANVLFEIHKKIGNALNTKNTDMWIKKQIVRSLYGVDINARAIEITMLRIWLWMAESFVLEGQYPNGRKIDETIEPLPNLEYHFMVGNSLIGYDKLDNITFQSVLLDSKTESTNVKELLGECVKLKKVYQNTSRFDSMLYPEKDPRKMKEKIEEIRTKMNDKLNASMYADLKKINADLSKKNFIEEYMPFHWILEFYEVYIEQDGRINHGFDIVIGNPPYIQLQKKEKIPKEMQRAYGSLDFNVFEKTGDIYCLFYEKGMTILKENGMLCYITSNKWMRAEYGKTLKNFFNGYNPITLLDFGGIKNFKISTVDTNILIISKEKNKNKLLATKFNRDYKENDDINEYVIKNQIVLTDLTEDAWFIGTPAETALKQKIEANGKLLKDWNIQINYGIKTGCNKAFIIDGKKKDELIANDPKSAEIIKPILRGRDIKRYGHEFAGLYLLATGYAIDIPNEYPEIFKYLKNKAEEIKKENKDSERKGVYNRDDQGKNWWNLRACSYYHEFAKEKVVWGNIAYSSAFCYSYPTEFINAPSNMLTSSKNNIKYILACMNSKIFSWEFSNLGIPLGYAYEWKKQYVERTHIPPITKKNRNISDKIEELVDKIISAKKTNPNNDTTSLEEEIDVLIYNLYNLTFDEVKIIDPEFTLSKKDYDSKIKKLEKDICG